MKNSYQMKDLIVYNRDADHIVPSNAIFLITGGFDPMHEGHIAMVEDIRMLTKSWQHMRNYGGHDNVLFGVNSDSWLHRKKGYKVLKWETRATICRNVKGAIGAFPFDDSDGTAIGAIQIALGCFPNNSIYFVNGGDRNKETLPEMSFEHPRLTFIFGVGGNQKQNSSSEIIEELYKDKLRNN